MKTIYDFAVKDIDGKERALSEFAGKVLLIVNVASKCGFTPQYKSLQALYERFKGRGFEILGFSGKRLPPAGAGHGSRDQELLQHHLRGHLPDVLQDLGEGQGASTRSTRSSRTRKPTRSSPARSRGTSTSSSWTARGTSSARFDSKDDPLGDKIPRLVGHALDH